MNLKRCHFERSPDGAITISASRTMAFLSFLGFFLVIVFIFWFFLKEPKTIKELLDAIKALENIFTERSNFFISITVIALLFFLPPLLKNLWIALKGEFFTFDKLHRTITKNGKYVASFDAFESVCIYEYFSKYFTYGTSTISYGLKLLMKDGRKISICRTNDKEKALHMAQDIADLLNLPEPLEKGQSSDFDEFAEKWFKKLRMGPY